MQNKLLNIKSSISYPATGIESRVLKSIKFGRELLMTENYELYHQYERLLPHLLGKELFTEYFDIFTQMVEKMPNFNDYCEFISGWTEQNGTT